MVLVLVLALAKHLVLLGKPRAAAGALVQFGGFLRPGELVALRAQDAALPEEVVAVGGPGQPMGMLALGTPTRGTKVNREQVAKLRHPVCISALRWLKRTTTGPKLLAMTYPQYNAAFLAAADQAGFAAAGLRFTPHCPRAGAATQAIIEGRPVKDIMDDGRWSNEKSLKMYLDVAMAMATRTLTLAQDYQYLLQDYYDIGPIFA